MASIFELCVDHKYRLANGKVALITGITEDKSQLMGVVVGEETIVKWSMVDGHAADGNNNLDLVQLITGPSRSGR